MSIDVNTLIACGTSLCTVLGFILVTRRNNRADAKQDASQMTTVIIKLETIGADVSEIKADLRNMKEEVRDLRDRLLINEQSLKSAWKKLDELKGEKL